MKRIGEKIYCFIMVVLYALVIFLISGISAVQIASTAVWTAYNKRGK